jgi:hypothetical protein
LNNFFVSFDRNLEPRGVDCVWRFDIELFQ